MSNQIPLLSRRVIEVGKDLFDTVQKKFLPIDASDEVLSENFFLKGQEKDAVKAWLFAPPQCLYIVVVPTWKCNLKCTHCCVQDRLKHPDEPEPEFHVASFMDFIARHKAKYTAAEKLGILFCGGEPILFPEKTGEIIDAVRAEYPEVNFNITTNLAMPLTDKHMEVLNKITSMTISIDGSEIEHNTQRVPVTPLANPYQLSIKNVQRLMIAGFQGKMNVQGCITSFEEEDIVEYFRAMLRLGFSEDRIKYATATPCEASPQVTEQFLHYLATQPRYRECCKYRYMQNFLIDNSGDVFSDFYCYDKVGKVTDPLSAIAANYEKTIWEMPVLNDPKCGKCRSLGYCWGGCANNNYLYKTQGSPSKYCKAEAKFQFIKKKAVEHFKGIKCIQKNRLPS